MHRARVCERDNDEGFFLALERVNCLNLDLTLDLIFRVFVGFCRCIFGFGRRRRGGVGRGGRGGGRWGRRRGRFVEMREGRGEEGSEE